MPIAENLWVCVSKKTPDSFWSQFFVVLIWKVFTISSPTTWMARKWRYDFHGTGESPFFIVDFGGSEIFPGSERRQLTHQDRRRRSRVQRPLPGQKTSEKRRQNWGRSRMIILWSSKTSNVSNVIDHQNPQIPPQAPTPVFLRYEISNKKLGIRYLLHVLQSSGATQFSRRHHKGMADSRSTPTSYMASSQNSGGL